eukprot:10939030-Alexandrium_andersonii.AAC.1
MAGPQRLPDWATAAPTARVSVAGRRGQPGTPNSGPMPVGSQAGARAQPRQTIRWARRRAACCAAAGVAICAE